MVTQTPVTLPFVEDEPRHLKLAVGACRLRVRPGQAEPWVTGTYEDPTEKLPVRLLHDGGMVTLTQGRDLSGIMGLFSGVPKLDLELGTARQYELSLEGGAIEVELDLGGLPLTRLTSRHGAGKVELDFSAPNPVDMATIELSVGAGGLEAERLGNANAASLRVEGGAAGYQLDLTGELRQRLDANVSAAMSGVEITLPRGVPSRITTDSVLGGVDLGDGFATREGAVWVGEGEPRITLRASVTFGGLKLRLAG